MKILARHKWVAGCTITESEDERISTKDRAYCRFTATIRGWRNWVIYEGFCFEGLSKAVISQVKKIRDRIDSEDESVFYENGTLTAPPGGK